MLEGVEKKAKQSKIIAEAQVYKDKLESKILRLCQDFENESGLTLLDIQLYRLNLQTLGANEKGDMLCEVKARVEL